MRVLYPGRYREKRDIPIPGYVPQTNNVPVIRELISDILSDYAAGTKDYTTAVKDAYIRIYQSVDPSFDPETQFAIDTYYRDIPAVDSAMFTIARKLLIESTVE